jgi:hypothetical protein
MQKMRTCPTHGIRIPASGHCWKCSILDQNRRRGAEYSPVSRIRRVVREQRIAHDAITNEGNQS